MTPPRFAVDKTLGRLCTWLRLLGFDASYGSHLSGLALIRHARAEDRILLTRNRRLCRQLNLPPLLFIESDHHREQLRQVFEALHLSAAARTLTRCSLCNVPLEHVTREADLRGVPEYVLQTQARVERCPRCHRHYWRATHDEQLQREIATFGITLPAKC